MDLVAQYCLQAMSGAGGVLSREQVALLLLRAREVIVTESSSMRVIVADSAPPEPSLASIAALRHEIFVKSELGASCPIYLDYNASTPVDAVVASNMLSLGLGLPCNPSSSHAFGRRARDAVSRAREQLALLVGAASPDCVTFVSCGTEASNWAIRGSVQAWRSARKGSGASVVPKVVTLKIEHPATVASCELLHRDASTTGAEVEYVDVDSECVCRVEDVLAAVDGRTCLVSVMFANNEVGSLMPIAAIAAGLDRKSAELGLSIPGEKRAIALHVDASQALGKVVTSIAELGCDYLTVAGHKMYAPTGCGALVVAEDAVWGVPPPLVVGAPQESGRRAGTVSVAMAVALGTASTVARAYLAAGGGAELWRLRSRLLSKLTEACAVLGTIAPQANGPVTPTTTLPNTLSVSFDGISAKALLLELDGVLAASLGSACASIDGKPSVVAAAMGLSPQRAAGTFRLSVGKYTTEAEVDFAAARIAAAVKALDDVRSVEPDSSTAGTVAETAAALAAAPAVPTPAASGAGGGDVASSSLTTIPLYFHSTTLTASVGRVLCAAATRPVEGDAKSMAATVCGEEVRLRVVDGCRGIVVLDRSVTHPQGGGQPADRGSLLWLGASGAALEAPIVHVCKGPPGSSLAGGILLHLGGEAGRAVSERLPAQGARVLATVDAAWRAQCARLHSAGHLLDAAMRSLAPHLEPGTGYHFPDRPSVQYSGKLNAAECADLMPRLQAGCDALIVRDAKTGVAVFKAGDAKTAEAAGATAGDSEGYPEGATVRIISVGDAENQCPCGGTHVERAGELAGLRILGIKSKKGTTKVTYDMGEGSAQTR